MRAEDFRDIRQKQREQRSPGGQWVRDLPAWQVAARKSKRENGFQPTSSEQQERKKEDGKEVK